VGETLERDYVAIMDRFQNRLLQGCKFCHFGCPTFDECSGLQLAIGSSSPVARELTRVCENASGEFGWRASLSR
jgi:hypothetical protein